MLPDKLSELLELALADLATVEADPNYEVNMGRWHRWCSDWKVCYVCLAGSVMAGTLKVPLDATAFPTDFEDQIMLKLRALDAAAHASMFELSEYTGKEISHYEGFVHYAGDREGWRAYQQTLVAKLKELGL